jgi:hypothetical protein
VNLKKALHPQRRRRKRRKEKSHKCLEKLNKYQYIKNIL